MDIGGTSMNSNPYFSPAAARPSRPLRSADSLETRIGKLKKCLLAVGIWQLACLAMVFIYNDPISHCVDAVYSEFFGDSQPSVVNYTRFHSYIRFIVMTLPASVLTIEFLGKLSTSKRTLKQKLLALSWLQVAAMFVLGVAYEYGFHYIISQILWRLFGLPSEIHSFQSIILPRIIAWLLCTTPIVWLAALTYSSSLDSHSEDCREAQTAPLKNENPAQ